jgi:hypothetical protein
MPQLTLHFKEDPKTGQHRLEAVAGRLSDDDLRQVEQDLRRQYTSLVHRGGTTLTIDKRLQALPSPARFRVRVQTGTSQRYPTLVLEYLPPEGSPAVPASGSSAAPAWPDGFLAELERLSAPEVLAKLTPAQRVGLRFAVDELRALGRERRGVLAPLLLAGYLTLAERMGRASDEERVGLYLLASRALDRLFGALLPAPVGPQDHGGGQSLRANLHGTLRFLAWVLGVDGTDDSGGE